MIYPIVEFALLFQLAIAFHRRCTCRPGRRPSRHIEREERAIARLAIIRHLTLRPSQHVFSWTAAASIRQQQTLSLIIAACVLIIVIVAVVVVDECCRRRCCHQTNGRVFGSERKDEKVFAIFKSPNDGQNRHGNHDVAQENQREQEHVKFEHERQIGLGGRAGEVAE